MTFSELHYISFDSADDWFDPILILGTNLFIDPFLLYATEDGQFVGSHAEVIAFFNSVFQLIAKSGGRRTSPYWKKAVDLLRFPEVEELCLGYAKSGTKGSGSGRKLARVVANSLWEAVQAGLTEITHFEEVSILREGIGADRISDITAGLIRGRLVSYTVDVCDRHSISLSPTRYLRGTYDVEDERWVPLITNLPRNTYNGRPILLVPRRYLRILPTISPEDFWEYCYYNENETLRVYYSQDVTKHVDKRTIIDFARRHPEIRKRYIEYVESSVPKPYDFSRDPRGQVQWYHATAEYTRCHPLAFSPTSKSEFLDAIDKMVKEFQNYVKNNQGWTLLWNDNKTTRTERAAQSLFLGIVKHYCIANDIDVSREADIGRGPVDFKVSHGYNLRALLEVKLAKNTRFWNGLERQLPKYQEAEDVEVGYFIVIVYTDRDLQKLDSIKERVAAVKRKTGYQISSVIVDSRYGPPSASKL